jgi:hypothetical protein
MSIATEPAAAALIAAAIFAHAWSGRIQGPPAVLSAMGWVIHGLTLLALLNVWVRC